jgi:hypothetical protein
MGNSRVHIRKAAHPKFITIFVQSIWYAYSQLPTQAFCLPPSDKLVFVGNNLYLLWSAIFQDKSFPLSLFRSGQE